ncbi:MAG: hypothetical protein US39_C0001G0073 [Microgenomates group bacterium GW2011_GWC1_37_12b]|nr:MAG: hypothetical protein US39_C0001G0073 [Microgenomates group bacterium GW2011_GWC1_37_12b]
MVKNILLVCQDKEILVKLISLIEYIQSGCSLTVECAAGGRAAAVRFCPPRHIKFHNENFRDLRKI